MENTTYCINPNRMRKQSLRRNLGCVYRCAEADNLMETIVPMQGKGKLTSLRRSVYDGYPTVESANSGSSTSADHSSA